MILKNGKGETLMLLLIVGIILTVASGVFVIISFAQITGTMGNLDLSCPTFCSIQADIEEYGVLDVMFPSFIPLVEESSDAAVDQMLDFLARPEGLGCYCGVQERSGKYIHVSSQDENKINEFHLTDQNPNTHLIFHLTDSNDDLVVTHRLGPPNPSTTLEGEKVRKVVLQKAIEKCKDALDSNDDFHSLQDLEYYEGCVIFSVLGNDKGAEGCAIYGFDRGVALTNEMEESIWSEVKDENKTIIAENNAETNPIKDLPVGDKATMEKKVKIEKSVEHDPVQTFETSLKMKPYQRLLLQNYRKGERVFGFHAPVVCRGSTREEKEAGTPMQTACKQYCENKSEVFVTTKCLESMRGQYEMLDEEYRSEEIELCPEGNQEPYCRCSGKTNYKWEVEEGYEP